MKITVSAHGALKKYFNFKNGEFLTADAPDGSSVADVLRNYNIPDGMVMFATVNGVKKDTLTKLCDGDVLVLIPPLSGG
ncbi:MAG: MoaD/ThiS family protein [Planctomycetes bacterium]|nr:MoaD/ThiS family protein [Planctomycetota bacterium]